jgi:lia operon protein LiaG
MRFVAILPFVLAGPAVVAAQQERHTLEGDDVAIYNLAGEVSVEAGQGSIGVQVSRGGGAAGQLRVEQGEIGGRETLRVIFPSDHIVYPPLGRGSSTQLRVRDDGTFGDEHGWDERPRSRRVTIMDQGDGLDAHADLRISVPGGRQVAIHLAVGKVTVTNVNGRISVDAHNAPVTATGTRGELSVDVGSGDVLVSQTEGALSVDTGSGSVEVSRYRGATLSVDTGSGDVTGSELEAAKLSIDTGSGDIRLTGVTAPEVTLEAGSGSVTTDLRREIHSLSVETGSGNIAITAPPTLSAMVAIETASGEIESDFPLTVTRHARDHVEGRIGDGKGTIAIETGSGGIRLLKGPQ